MKYAMISKAEAVRFENQFRHVPHPGMETLQQTSVTRSFGAGGAAAPSAAADDEMSITPMTGTGVEAIGNEIGGEVWSAGRKASLL